MDVAAEPARIAVIVPCFNDGAFVGATVDSVVEAEEVELVVIDDGSDDQPTLEVLDALVRKGVRVLRQANAGVAAARMAGLHATTAPLVFPLDSDDLAIPGVLGAMADCLTAAPEAVLCYGDYEEFGDGHELMRAVPEWVDPFRLAYANEYPGMAMWRREALDALGGWTSSDVHEDWDLWMRTFEHGLKAVYFGRGRPTFRRRTHSARRGAAVRTRHREVYRALRDRHPMLFRSLAEHRRRSDMPGWRKLLYPVVYGGRPRFRFEQSVKAALDRVGIWTLRR